MSRVSKKLPAIKTERAYERALEEIYGLMDAEPGTPEDERLEVLVTLVVAYEDKHHNPEVFLPRIIARNEFRQNPSLRALMHLIACWLKPMFKSMLEPILSMLKPVKDDSTKQAARSMDIVK